MISKLLTPKFTQPNHYSGCRGRLFLSLSGYLTPLFSFSISPFISAQSWLAQRYLALVIFQFSQGYGHASAENAALNERVAMLQSEIVALQETWLNLIFCIPCSISRVESRTRISGGDRDRAGDQPYLQYIIIDKGSNDGLRHGMPVVTQQGLVGRIDALILRGQNSTDHRREFCGEC